MKKKLIKNFAAHALKILLPIVVFILASNIYKTNYKTSPLAKEEYPFSIGGAQIEERNQILSQLRMFQEGYTERDLSKVKDYMTKLFSKKDVIALGTMPNEVFVGFEEVSDLVYTDWESWGDCKFFIENAQISSTQDVAWFSTVGFVEFDISSLLVVPLRLSGVMGKEADGWMIKHLQFQFDLDFSFIFFLIFLSMIWIMVSVIVFALFIIKTYVPKKD